MVWELLFLGTSCCGYHYWLALRTTRSLTHTHTHADPRNAYPEGKEEKKLIRVFPLLMDHLCPHWPNKYTTLYLVHLNENIIPWGSSHAHTTHTRTHTHTHIHTHTHTHTNAHTHTRARNLVIGMKQKCIL